MLLSPTSTQYLVGTPWRFLTGSCEGAYASQISLLTKQTLFFVCLSFARLLLLPKRTKVSFGDPFPYKTARIWWIFGVFAEPENSCTLSTLGFSKPAKNPKNPSKFWLFRDFGDPAGYWVPVGRRSKRAKDKQTKEKSLFGQKWDLRRSEANITA